MPNAFVGMGFHVASDELSPYADLVVVLERVVSCCARRCRVGDIANFRNTRGWVAVVVVAVYDDDDDDAAAARAVVGVARIPRAAI